MIREVSATAVRSHWEELLHEVQYCHDSVLITKAGRGVAALVGIELFHRVRRMDAEFQRLTSELASAYEGADEAVTGEELAEATAAARAR